MPWAVVFATVFAIGFATGFAIVFAIGFATGFAIAACIVSARESSIDGFGNAARLMLQVVTTIGLGDYTCTGLAGRVAAVVLSVYSVFFLALITGAVVSYCRERMARLAPAFRLSRGKDGFGPPSEA